MNPWEGKHIWIWELELCGAPQNVVNKAVALDLAGLLIKGWDGSNYWPQIESIVEKAHNAGLIIGAWGYSYGTNPSGEAEAARRCLAAGADWLVIDAEAEYEQYPSRAQAVLKAFRLLGAPLGYSSFGIPSYHTGFPWQIFSEACAVAIPQVYWGDFGMTVDRALSSSLNGLMTYGLPVAPAGQLYDNVTADAIIRFADICKNAGLPGISYWSWQHADETKLAAVGSAVYEKGRNNVSDWAKASWDKAKLKGIMDGTDPQGTVTREMLAVVLDRCGLLDAVKVSQKVVDTLKQQD
ncbi:MAG: hypothetical protein A4E52_00310 [Pelotomaculum sp. PtaB.Bin013]|uniref:Uncharacterized protein n=1 Tax=Pelotomaculum isophthalicicum JI TaxID=947010 RepID=A0A9X4JWI0_9FIRM|nr:hypothetical protein [Pelotomaculum isophthalicicum]MDF9409342.1 hypothetical protein [Pelotomaculum isophthalicicum JI]OPX91832.1 MAG: hypothetical protein A4E52_00310 [Pelotomaculum sp. PtaB.Bin013]